MEIQDRRVIGRLAKSFDQTIQPAQSGKLWKALTNCGTELWLDTGDMEAIDKLWDSSMTAVTTNNTLLNQEIQKGIYDKIAQELSLELKHIEDPHHRIREIAFFLNALHGLRLAHRYKCKVSVELHTDLSHHVDQIVAYGIRFHAISPDNFIVKVPFTPSGLLGARILHEKGIPVNLTLQFSARQNVLTAIVAKPAFTNVFMGRVQAYIESNKLQASPMFSETVVEQTQLQLWHLREKQLSPTRLIAASLRHPSQLLAISGSDVFTIPPSVAEKGINSLDAPHAPAIVPTGQATYAPAPALLPAIASLGTVPDTLVKTALYIDKHIPKQAKELEKILTDNGFGDIFPNFSPGDMQKIAADGKIPVHAHWEKLIGEKRYAIDSLLTEAGLASFTADQAQLDNRILSLI
ncbi:MAG: transaldolase family protein [Breznakibacter sp.]